MRCGCRGGVGVRVCVACVLCRASVPGSIALAAVVVPRRLALVGQHGIPGPSEHRSAAYGAAAGRATPVVASGPPAAVRAAPRAPAGADARALALCRAGQHAVAGALPAVAAGRRRLAVRSAEGALPGRVQAPRSPGAERFGRVRRAARAGGPLRGGPCASSVPARALVGRLRRAKPRSLPHLVVARDEAAPLRQPRRGRGAG